MDHDTLMLKCLELATMQQMAGDQARTEAAKMFAQITGRSVEEVMRNTRTQIGSGNARADVVGKDGDLDKPFKDYLKGE